MVLHVVIGNGAVGATTVEMLAERGLPVRVISRSGGTSTDHVEHVALDASNAGDLIGATKDASAIYNCVNPPYHRWTTDWPPLATAMLDAAEASDAVLVTCGNLYGYGPVEGPMREDLPLAATGKKAQVRIRMWEEALERHQQGRARVVEARSADLFGPKVTSGGHLAERVVPHLLHGRTANVIGDPDAAHSWGYVPDVARALIRLAHEQQSWGQAWHTPTTPPTSIRDAVKRMCRIADVPMVSVRGMPGYAHRLAGVFSPLLRELREVRYQFDYPFVVDSSRYTDTFHEEATPLDEALRHTVAWWRDR